MTLNFSGQMTDFSHPQVMGILNVTPDSFFAGSRVQTDEAVVARAHQILDEGGTIIDVGACSTRPGSQPVPADEEWQRLDRALGAIRRALPGALVSVDTFRAEVARRCVEEHGVQIINDVGAGRLDPQMLPVVAQLGVPYVLTSSQIDCSGSDEQALSAVARDLAEGLQQAHDLGVADVILDPGFGFGKTLEQNYALMRHLHRLIGLFPDCPFLVGISRKSMIWRLLGTTPEDALPGTIVLGTVALQAGAHLLRVHDVREAVETIKILGALNPPSPADR